MAFGKVEYCGVAPPPPLRVGSSPAFAVSCVACLFWLQDPNAKAGKFGFAVDNTIGATPQPNGWMDNWVDFYRERRIRHQLQLLGKAQSYVSGCPVT